MNNTGTTLTAFFVGMTPASQILNTRIVSLGSTSQNDYSSSASCVAIYQPGSLVGTYRNPSQTFGTITLNQPYITCSLYDGTSGYTFLNGSPSGTSFASTGSFNITAYGVGNYSFAPAGSEPFIGFMGEVIVFNTALTTFQRQSMEGYLAWKWGLQNNLPDEHPYKFIIPNFPTNFTPTSITGAQLWLDGADTSTITSNATTGITQWVDKSVNQYTAVPAMFTIPGCVVWVSPGVFFNEFGPVSSVTNFGTAGGNLSLTSGTVTKVGVAYPSSVYLSFAAGSSMSLPSITYTQTSRTVIAVVTVGATGEFRQFLNGGQNSRDIQFYSYNTNLELNCFGVGVHLQYVPSPQNFFNSISIICATSTTADRGVFINGAAQTTGVNDTGSYSTGTTTTQVIGNGGGSFDVYEMMVFDGALTASQRQQVEAYLAYKYNLQSKLPPSHPYYATLFHRVFTVTSTYYLSTIPTIVNTTQNNLNAIRTNGQILTINNYTWSSWATTFFVVKTGNISFFGGTAATSYRGGYIGTFNYSLYDTGTASFYDSVLPAGTQVIPLNQWCIFSIGYGGGTQATNYAVNGTLRASTTSSPGGYQTAASPLWISAYGPSAITGGDDITIGEVIQFNRSITSQERQTIETYLSRKWNIPLPYSIPSFVPVFSPFPSPPPTISNTTTGQPSVFFPAGAQMTSVNVPLAGTASTSVTESIILETVITSGTKSITVPSSPPGNITVTFAVMGGGGGGGAPLFAFSSAYGGGGGGQGGTTITSVTVPAGTNITYSVLIGAGGAGAPGAAANGGNGGNGSNSTLTLSGNTYIGGGGRGGAGGVYGAVTIPGGLGGTGTTIGYAGGSAIHGVGGQPGFGGGGAGGFIGGGGDAGGGGGGPGGGDGGRNEDIILPVSGFLRSVGFSGSNAAVNSGAGGGGGGQGRGGGGGGAGGIPPEFQVVSGNGGAGAAGKLTITVNSYITVSTTSAPRSFIALYQCPTSATAINIGIGNNISGGAFGICQSNNTLYAPYQYVLGDVSFGVANYTGINYAFTSFDASTNILSGFPGFNDLSGKAVAYQNNAFNTPFYIGSSSALYTSSGFHLCEFIATSNAISSTERENVEGYLAWKWGISGQLPSDHPYALFPPSGEQWISTVTPANICGLISWLDANDPGLVTTYNKQVWTDTGFPLGTLTYKVNEIACSSNGVYILAAAYGYGVYINSNSGNPSSWSNVFSDSGGNFWFNVAMSSTGQVMYASSSNTGIWRSISYGDSGSWSNVLGGYGGFYYHNYLACDSTGRYVYTTVDIAGVSVNSNYGQGSWTITLGARVSLVTSSYGSIVYAVSADTKRVYKSTDYGQTWSVVYDGGSIILNFNPLSITTDSTGTYVAVMYITGPTGREFFIQASSNGGTSWSNVYSLNAAGQLTYQLAYSSNGQYLIAVKPADATVAALLINSNYGFGPWTDSYIPVVTPGGTTTGTPQALALKGDGTRIFASTQAALMASTAAPTTAFKDKAVPGDVFVLDGTYSMNNIRTIPSLSIQGTATETFTSIPSIASALVVFFPQSNGTIVGWGGSSPTLTLTNVTTARYGTTTYTLTSAPQLTFIGWGSGNYYSSLNGGPLTVTTNSLVASTSFTVGQQVGEVVLYNDFLEQPSRQILEGYLARKWNITGNLPTTHPYYYSTPTLDTLKDVGSLSIPTLYPSLTLWMDAADTTFTGTQWLDKSPIGDIFKVNGANPLPTFSTIKTSGPSIPGVYFAGQASLVGTVISPMNTGTGSCFVVLSPSGTSNAQILTGSSSAERAFGFFYSPTIAVSPYQGAANSKMNSFGGITNSPMALFAQINGGNTGQGSVQFSLSPTSQGTAGTALQPVAPSSSTWTMGFGAGGLTSLQQGFFLHELVCFSTYLSTLDRQKMEGYLAWKWGMQGQLPSGHPYAARRP
jgi:hypothetical protein